MIIGNLKLISAIASRLYDRFKAAGRVLVPTLPISRHDCYSRSQQTVDQIGYINRVLDRFEMADCRKRSTPMEVGHKPHAIQTELGEKPFDTGMYGVPEGNWINSVCCSQH
jgi:hypothetical protein